MINIASQNLKTGLVPHMLFGRNWRALSLMHQAIEGAFPSNGPPLTTLKVMAVAPA